MDGFQTLQLDKQLCFALYACSREITRRYRPLLEPLGLTYTQYIALLALWEAGKLRMKELGAALHLDSGTLTPLVKKLESAGLVKRARDAQDERNLWVEVTAAGWQLREQAVDIPYQAFCQSGISVQEGQALFEQLHTLLGRLQPGDVDGDGNGGDGDDNSDGDGNGDG